MRMFTSLHTELRAAYGDDLQPRMASVLHRLVSRSDALTAPERARLLAALDRGEPAAANALYAEWDNAYLDYADEHDGDEAAEPAVRRLAIISRLAAAVSAYLGTDCREPAAFGSM